MVGSRPWVTDQSAIGIESPTKTSQDSGAVPWAGTWIGSPRIVRFHGHGEVIVPGSDTWPGLSSQFPSHPSMRAIVRIHVTRVSDSCGFGVPQMKLVGHRDVIDRWVETKGLDNLPAYRKEKNARSIDGLPTADFDE